MVHAAPEATRVTVSGDFGNDGTCGRGGSATTGPLNPEMYVYYFIVDGVRLTDRLRHGGCGPEGSEDATSDAREGRNRAYVPRNRGRASLARLAPLLFK